MRKYLLAGIMIGVAGILYCSTQEKTIAALFFSIGLIYIRISGLYLYTGQVQNILLRQTNWKELLFGLFHNLSGVFVVLMTVGIVLLSSKEEFCDSYAAICNAKWIYPFYYYIASGVMCGILMTIATKRNAPLWLSIMCVMAFILAGFNHCIADFMYINSFDAVFKWFLVLIGNTVGGLLATT